MTRVTCVVALLIVLGTTAASAQNGPEVYFMEPPDGAVIRGEPWVKVTGRARSPDPRPATFDVMIVMDTSGSTRNPSGLNSRSFGLLQGGRDSILSAEVGAVNQFLGVLDRRTTRVGIITFAGAHQAFTGLGVPGSVNAWVRQPLTSDYEAVRTVLLDIMRRGSTGGTDMAAGLRLAIRELRSLQGALSRPRPAARKVALLLTDGFPTLPFGSVNDMDLGDEDVTINTARVAAKGGILIHTFCLGPEALSAPRACTEVALVTGGLPTPVETPGEIVNILPTTRIGNVDLVAVRNLTTGQMARSLTVSAEGVFTAEVPLVSGGNQLVVELHGSDNRQARATIVLHYRREDVRVEVAREPERTLEIHIEQPRPRDKRLDLKIESLAPTR
ncbi:MAG: VWA domain-containing protein [Candidatus Methylomirabilia bacterium]